ncbi:MAG TPA: hypothetical protein VHN77_12690 [Phycisphaerales bacterium]|nr:hypothetical protein [Phycisphaerales bacterium]
MASSPLPNRISQHAEQASADLAHAFASEEASEHAGKRSIARLGLPTGYTIIGVFSNPGGQSPPIVLSVRDISNGGMGIMHANFVHVGSGCSFALVGPNRKLIVKVQGEVVRCTHYRGNVHDIGIRFTEPVKLELYIPALQASEEAVVHATLLSLSGQVARQVRTQAAMDDIRRTIEVMLATIESVADQPSRGEA